MFEDLKELFATMTGYKAQQANQADNMQTELLKKMCAALDTLPDRINGKVPSLPTSVQQRPSKSTEVVHIAEPELIPDAEIHEVIHHHTDEEFQVQCSLSDKLI